MEGRTGNSKNVPKKNTSLSRMMGFRQYTVCPQCEPKSLQPAYTKFSTIVTIPTFIISDSSMFVLFNNISYNITFTQNIIPTRFFLILFECKGDCLTFLSTANGNILPQYIAQNYIFNESVVR